MNEEFLKQVFNKFHSTRHTEKFSIDGGDMACLLQLAYKEVTGKGCYHDDPTPGPSKRYGE